MKRPDELLTNVEHSIFTRALVLSIVLHLVLIGATSVSLFKDWTEFGIHSPSYINNEKTRIRREAEEARRREEAEKKAAAEEAKAAEMRASVTNKVEKAAMTVPAESKGETKAPTEAETDKAPKTPPEVQPLPPKKKFEYGEDLTLD